MKIVHRLVSNWKRHKGLIHRAEEEKQKDLTKFLKATYLVHDTETFDFLIV
jgi:hypothetical protein